MVSDHLKTLLRSGRKRIQPPPLTITLAMGGGTLALILLAWIVADDGRRLQAGARPSLLDLLDQVSTEKIRVQKGTSAGVSPGGPPLAQRWSSPLSQQCSGIDPLIKRRLESQKKQLERLRRPVSIDSTNYGKRYRQDAFGRRLDPTPRLVVLHETVYSLDSALNTFKTPHPRDEDQASYHTLIGLDGKITDLVDPAYRAFGSGNSAFLGEWAITNARFDGSVNNFSLHLSVETPQDGRNNNSLHSGYTESQYDSLALVISDWMERFDFSAAAITTHQHVDLGGERSDPRSFNWSSLQDRLAALGDLC